MIALAITTLFLSALMWAEERETVRIAYFPNIAHAQAIVGRVRGTFQEKLGADISLDWKIFNAGPSVIEAIFAGHLDIAYVGPNPAMNGYVKSDGEALCVIAGAATEGSALVVRREAALENREDFRGRRVAAPQVGNTQDVALRSWFMDGGIKTQEVGGDVRVISADGATIVTLFSKGEIDGAFVAEPWVSVLEQREGGRIILMDSELLPGRRYVTTLVVVRKKFLDGHPDKVKGFLQAHLEITDWINTHRGEAKRIVGLELEKLTYNALPEAILDSAFERVRFDWDPLQETVMKQGHAAYRLGYLKKEPNLSGLFDLQLLDEVLTERKQKAIETLS